MTFIGELIYPSATSAIIADPRLVALFDLWNAGRAASGAEMPSRASLPAEDLVRWWPALTLLEFEGPPADLRLRIRVHGGDIVSLDGVNGTGRLLADIFDRARFDKVKPGYMTVAIMNRPAYHKRESGDFQGYPVVYEKLLLPLAGPQGQLQRAHIDPLPPARR
ncbi:MAG: PAS domain-containing protein [Proteobacteria bacterium]|nr:PAS domain-containing protein [Pseudomonadota bacterium]